MRCSSGIFTRYDTISMNSSQFTMKRRSFIRIPRLFPKKIRKNEKSRIFSILEKYFYPHSLLSFNFLLERIFVQLQFFSLMFFIYTKQSFSHEIFNFNDGQINWILFTIIFRIMYIAFKLFSSNDHYPTSKSRLPKPGYHLFWISINNYKL